jgi:NAD(P)-dependent dehydrogenase (short-subunit alcohol dehydrogenase family)
MQFSSKVALVTGGSSGIGFGIATHLAQLGAQVVIVGRVSAKLAKAAQSIGFNVSWIAVDVTKVAEIDALYETIRREMAAWTSLWQTPAEERLFLWDRSQKSTWTSRSIQTSRASSSPFSRHFR